MPYKAEIYYSLHMGGDGAKFPVVLIHGAGGTHLNWPPYVRRLPGYRVFALDLPGHGKSGGLSQQSIAAYARLVIAWFEELGLGRAVFVGHSMGSAIALQLALTHPQQVVGLGLIGSGARLRVHPDLIQDTSSETTFHRAVDMVVSWSFSSNTPQRLVELATKRMLENRPIVLHNDFVTCDSFDIIERIPEIKQPSLIICGEDDCMTPIRFSQYLRNNLSASHLKTIPEAGHMVMLEKPEQVADGLIEFLDQLHASKRTTLA
ncbi:MAG: alpha/beta hydrolase [Anaerolineales bacterium]|nr:alpha/beta hydrolase [Anaerolineales bacterium]